MTVFLRQCRNNFIKYESNHLAILVRRSSSNSSSNTRSSFTKSGKVEIWIIYFLVPTLPLHISQYKQIIHIPGFTKQNINANCPFLYIIGSLLWKFFLVEPGRTPLFWGWKVSVLATRTLCLMYSMAKVGEC